MHFKSAFFRMKFQLNLNLPVRQLLRQIFLRLKSGITFKDVELTFIIHEAQTKV